jgi:uncharacterized protein YjdB
MLRCARQGMRVKQEKGDNFMSREDVKKFYNLMDKNKELAEEKKKIESYYKEKFLEKIVEVCQKTDFKFNLEDIKKSSENVEKFWQELSKNEKLKEEVNKYAEKLKQKKYQKIKELGLKVGLNLTIEGLQEYNQKMIKELIQNKELSDEELEKVVGGAVMGCIHCDLDDYECLRKYCR